MINLSACVELAEIEISNVLLLYYAKALALL
jgi:hypothetical protein